MLIGVPINITNPEEGGAVLLEKKVPMDAINALWKVSDLLHISHQQYWYQWSAVS